MIDSLSLMLATLVVAFAPSGSRGPVAHTIDSLQAAAELAPPGTPCHTLCSGVESKVVDLLSSKPERDALWDARRMLREVRPKARTCPLRVRTEMERALLFIEDALDVEAPKGADTAPRPKSVPCWNKIDPACKSIIKQERPAPLDAWKAFASKARADSFKLRRAEKVKHFFQDHPVSIHQLREILSWFKSDIIKQEIVQAAIGRIVDPQRGPLLKASFSSRIITRDVAEALDAETKKRQNR